MISATHEYVRIPLFVAPLSVLIPPNNRYNLANVNVPMDDTHTLFHFIAWGEGEDVPDAAAWREFCGAEPGHDIDPWFRKRRNRANNYLQYRMGTKEGTSLTGV